MPEPGTVHDIRASAGPGQIIAKLGAAEEGRRREQELRQALQPLGLAAAYKILDQLVEHVLRANNISHGWG